MAKQSGVLFNWPTVGRHGALGLGTPRVGWFAHAAQRHILHASGLIIYDASIYSQQAIGYLQVSWVLLGGGRVGLEVHQLRRSKKG